MDGWITDSMPSERYPVYTRANAGEVAPNPVSPLTATLNFLGPAEHGWEDCYVRGGTFRRDELDQDRPCAIGIFGGYLFLNMSMTRIFGARCPGMTPEMVDFQYFGTMPGIPPYVAGPTDDDPEATARLAEWLQTSFSATALPQIDELRAEVDRVVAGRPPLGSVTDAELVARARSVLGIYRTVFDHHIEMSALCGLGIGTVAGICQAIGRPELVTELVAAAGDVDSAAPSHALWDLSRRVAASPRLTAAFDEGVDGVLSRVDEAFLDGWRDFADRFGSRGPDEWDLRSPVWGTDPSLALAAVDRMRLAPDGDAPARKAEALTARRLRVAAEVRAALSGEPLAQFDSGLHAALQYSAGRERTKTVNIKLVHEQRLALLELGRRMAERGHLDHADHVFMLLDAEVDAFVADATSFRAVLRQRDEDYRALFELEPPFVFVAPPPPVSAWKRRGEERVEPAPPGTVLSGIPGSAGRAKGRARVVLDPGDPAGLEPGDILVAPVTDPAWTPLFVPAAAVVVDVGAQITHAVIVSRELGIPCVVSVTDATRRIPDGSMLEVDGSAGTVTLI